MQVVPFDALACPICGLKLEQRGKSTLCANRHCFDFDRKGALNLLPVQLKNSRAPGDSKEMVAARRVLLDSGLYKPIADRLNHLLAQFVAQRQRDSLTILDAGCGEGYYTSALLDDLSWLEVASTVSMIGMDISKDAIWEASKRRNDIAWITGTNKKIPILDRSVDVVISLFGFPVWEEFRRVLKPNGMVVMADPGSDHLIELRRVLYPQVTEKSDNDSNLPDGFVSKHLDRLSHVVPDPSREDIAHILAMTPHGYRATHDRKQAALEMDFPALTLDVLFRVYALEMPS